jgi:hypothetical protein
MAVPAPMSSGTAPAEAFNSCRRVGSHLSRTLSSVPEIFDVTIGYSALFPS